jgi:intracellular sulfur oxidation DsrE/DsrF family protein
MMRAFPSVAAVLCLSAWTWAFAQTPTERKLVYPIIPNVGGVVPLPDAAEQPRTGAKVVFDVTTDSKSNDMNKGLERVARLLNLYGSTGFKASDVKIAVVMHGEATKSVLTHVVYKEKFGNAKNPNLAVIDDLRKAGVEIFVCGQALASKGFAEAEVAEGIKVAAAALTVVINRQSDGYAYIPAH